MILINIKNIEELLFLDSNIKDLLPDLRHIFDQWLMSKRITFLRSLKTKSLLDLLNILDKNHIKILEEYYGDTLILDKLDYHLVQDLTLLTDKNKFVFSKEFANLAISRDMNNLYITFWR